MTDLAVLPDASPAPSTPFPHAQFTQTGLQIADSMPYDEWESLGFTLKRMEQSVNWALADWLNFGEQHYPDRYTQALEQTDYKHRNSLYNIAYVGRQFANADMRRDTLSFSHHAEVASLPPLIRDELLDRAEQEGLSAKELRSEAVERKHIEKEGTPTWIIDAATTTPDWLEAVTADGRGVQAGRDGALWFSDKAGRKWQVSDLRGFIREAYALDTVLQRHFGKWPDKK
jgi:hypothetical protein